MCKFDVRFDYLFWGIVNFSKFEQNAELVEKLLVGVAVR